ncbi:hypothetical protein HPB50_007734 [Hyalomma asiaticum]|uniref:Uncharacterized protein n=1 Tax=Hyalomma asiaticum TaxID=266040 RepID=A0ACB7RXX0_HYAAI|nr:hypothetical protein HPB50_007734 [Hyalomma asiaticum]
MQTDLPGERSAPMLGWTYDANSGKTTENEHIEWLQVGRRRKQTLEPTKPSQEMSAQQDKPTPQAPKQRSQKMPPFSTDDFKIVYRPQAGLDLSKWNLTAITHAIGRSSGLTQQNFYDNVRVQMQKIENIIIASTADTERATRLKSITTIQLGGTIFKVNAHVRHPDDVCRVIIYGLLPGTSSAEIVAGLRVDPRYTVLGARMLGRSSTAVITFDGPHVPYYITYQSGDYRCKPYRKQDICPRSRETFCYKCGQDVVSEAHDCLPKCKICEQAHETAGKECKKKLRPCPPPYQVRQQQLIKAKARECPWNPSCDEFPELNNPPTASGSPPQGQPGSSSPILRSRSRSRTRSRSRSRSRSVQRISYADVAQGHSKSHHKHTLVSPAETTAVKALENRVLDQQKMLQSHRDKIQSQGAIVDKLAKLCKEQEEIIKKRNENIEKLTRLFQEQLLSKQPAPNLTKEEIEAVVEAKIVSVIETKLAALVGSHLTTLVEPNSTAIVESRIEAIVDTKLEPVTIQIGNTFTTLNRAMDTHTAQINELKSQLTNFIAHETNTEKVRLSRYKTLSITRRTATLLKKNFTAQEHKIEGTTVEHNIVEVIPDRKSHQSLYITNVYSPPKDQLADYDCFIRELRRRTKGHQLVVVGDFNAPHAAWGYTTTTKKGTRVHDTAQQHGLTLWNDSLQPTRVGNSVSRDTTPDLTFTRDVKKVKWTCPPKTLGSDHHVIQLDINYARRPVKTGTARLTEWNAFRSELDHDTAIKDIDVWLKNVVCTAERYTNVIQLNEDKPAVDSHLLHLWEARRALLKRWKRQKLNRRLKQRIASLAAQAQEYAEQLARQNWRAFCDQLQGTLSTKKTWRLLRALLDDGPTKTHQREHIRLLTHNYDGSGEDLLKKLCEKLRGPTQPVTTLPSFKEYEGLPNADLDRPFTLAELHGAIAKLTRNTSPGKDRIVNKHLRQLPNKALTALLQYYNECWDKGELPASWKHSEVFRFPCTHRWCTRDVTSDAQQVDEPADDANKEQVNLPHPSSAGEECGGGESQPSEPELRCSTRHRPTA